MIKTYKTLIIEDLVEEVLAEREEQKRKNEEIKESLSRNR